MSLLNKIVKTTTTTALLALGTITAFNQSANAYSLVPQQEGEVNVGLNVGCALTNSCLTLDPLVKSVTSLTDSTTGAKSRLFVDDLLTLSEYDGGAIQFLAKDAGTNPSGFWFRPVETGELEEKGQLEVGTFKFEFTEVIPELTLAYFDTEAANSTGVTSWTGKNPILQTDGILAAGNNPVLAGPNSNIAYQTWTNVSYITLKLGKDYAVGTGDGVDFQIDAEGVPEPSTTLGLGILGLFGALKLRKRQQNG
jgi:hypothetical protein